MNYQGDIREWLEADGLGGFSSGTVCGTRTRRYHAVLLVATRPPAGRVVLVHDFDAWVETPLGTFPISTQQYSGGAFWPHGDQALRDFTIEPWPTWEFAVTDAITIRQELFVPRGVAGVALRWSAVASPSGVRLHVRPFLSGRDYHSLHHENVHFDFASVAVQPSSKEAFACVAWQPYADVPQVFAESNAAYEARPKWFRNFVYEQERQRGLDFTEDLASPGEFHWDLETEDAVLLLGASKPFSDMLDAPTASPAGVFSCAEAAERKRRTAFVSPLHRSADAYIVERHTATGIPAGGLEHNAATHRGQTSTDACRGGKTIIAGYPWFTDWGRDTFIAMRGLCLRPDRLCIAQQILLAWAETVSEGMLPNRFPDHGAEPEYNSVDASLWYIIAAYDYLEAMKRHGRSVSASDQAALRSAVEAILTGYSCGTRYGIRLEDDGLLAAGVQGVQLTWMDAKVGDWVVTPRIGKPVEIQALWLNALHVAATVLGSRPDSDGRGTSRKAVATSDWSSLLKHGRRSFIERFWNPAGGYLFDVVDVDHQAGTVDDRFRPNQIFAVGGLPLQLLDGEQARCVVDAVEERLLTPLGLRTLDPGHADYRPSCEGGVWERDGAYHQGTVWPWLLGPFVEAWVRVRGNTPESKHDAHRRFVEPLQQHLKEAGLGHISEIADAEPPHTPRGCPFQAWSLGELLRLSQHVLQGMPP